MLDVYQVIGIVKQAQAEYKDSFEKRNPDLVDYLSERIIEKAQLGELNTNIFTKDIFDRFPNNVVIENIIKYLTIKGFYVELITGILKGVCGQTIEEPSSCEKIIEPKSFLRISCPKH